MMVSPAIASGSRDADRPTQGERRPQQSPPARGAVLADTVCSLLSSLGLQATSLPQNEVIRHSSRTDVPYRPAQPLSAVDDVCHYLHDVFLFDSDLELQG